MGKKPAAKRVALYARVSTNDGRQETKNQLLQLRQHCRRQGWKLIREYVDEKSGGTARRPQFQRMFRDARTREFDLILFWALDRFSREGTLETLQHLEKLNSFGVDWKSLTEEYVDSCGVFRDAIIGIIAAIAKQERVRRSERATAAIERLRKQGKTDHLGRPRRVVDREAIRQKRAEGAPVAQLLKQHRISRATLYRILEEAA
jgi:DNA invertase Pin-like site-specific DNA recombinase